MRRLSLPWIAFGALACFTLPDCAFSHRGLAFFGAFRAVSIAVIPPVRGLVLWIEGDSLTGNTSTVVTSWPDMRGQSINQVRAWRQGDGSLMSGTVTTSSISTPAGTDPPTRSVNALRCAMAPRCSYVLADAAGTPRFNVLTGRPYAIFAVARRASSRGDQYVVMTDGVGCDSDTGINCTSNTALHLGWSGERTLRLDQYGNPSVMDPVPVVDATARSLLIGQADSRGKMIALLEPDFNGYRLATDTRPLGTSTRLYVGGTAWADNNAVPNWFLVGDIFAVLIYSVELTDVERRTVTDYLRTRYGPR